MWMPELGLYANPPSSIHFQLSLLPAAESPWGAFPVPQLPLAKGPLRVSVVESVTITASGHLACGY